MLRQYMATNNGDIYHKDTWLTLVITYCQVRGVWVQQGGHGAIGEVACGGTQGGAHWRAHSLAG